MPSEIITIASTLAAAVIAGYISYLAGRSMKTHEWKLAQAKDELSARKALYTLFLAEAQRLIVQASEDKAYAVSELDELHKWYAEITLVGSSSVVEAAMTTVDSVLLAYLREQDASDASDFHERRQAFIKSARAELQSFREA